MSMKDKTLNEFTYALGDKVSVPGGGGAAALAASLAAALGMMVGNFTVDKPKFLGVNDRIKELMAEEEQLRVELLDCIDKDAEGFEPLSKAYSMPKDTPGYQETMEKCLRDAAAVPFKILELSTRAIELAEEFRQIGSKLMISDAGCSAVLAWSAMYAAALNVKVNTKLMKDRDYAKELNDKTDAYLEKYWKIADKTYEDVFEYLKN